MITTRLPSLSAVVLAAVLAGCGSSSKSRSAHGSAQVPATPSTPSTGTATTVSSAGPAERDAQAQAIARKAQTAAETMAVDNNGSFAGLTPGALAHTDPSIPTAGHGKPSLSAAHGTANGYSITATSTTGDTFTITRQNGSVDRTCTGHASTACRHGKW